MLYLLSNAGSRGSHESNLAGVCHEGAKQVGDVEEREEYKRLAKDFFSKLQVDDKVRAVGLEEDLDIGHVDNEPHMLKKELARAGQMIQMLYRAVDKYDGEGEVDVRNL